MYKAKRNVATSKLGEIPSNGKTGEWRISKSERGYVTRDNFLEILSDIVSNLDRKGIKRPVIIFVDGYQGQGCTEMELK